MSSRHDADPLHLRHVASRTGLPEWFVACAASLALTFSFSIVQFVLVCTPLRLALAPVLAVGETDDPPILQPLWTALLTNEPWGTYVSAAAFPGILASVYYFVSCMVYSAIDIVNAPSFNDKYRLQPGAPQRPDAWAHALFLTGSHYVLLIVPGILWQVATQGPWLYWDGSPCVWGCDGARLFPSAAPRLDHMLIHLVICFVVFDASYHFWHWTHHASPVLYRHVHSVHSNPHPHLSPLTSHLSPSPITDHRSPITDHPHPHPHPGPSPHSHPLTLTPSHAGTSTRSITSTRRPSVG